MATASAYSKTGAKSATSAKLDVKVFGFIPKDHALLKQAYVTYLANGRTNLATTKTRGEVSGGGKKPWKQKGTGRARFGSSRVPIWRGGGITFGPTGNENYSKQMTSKSRNLAIRQALSLAAEDKKIIIIEDIVIKSGKTADLVRLLSKVGASRRTLLVVNHKSDELLRASNNIAEVKLVQASYVNVYDVLNAHSIVMTNASLKQVTDRLIAEPKTKPNEVKPNV